MFKYALFACFATAVFGELPHPPKARIAGAHDVDIKQYPYHVQLHEKIKGNDGSLDGGTIYRGCNGAIISPKHVVSTASCINPYASVEIDPATILVKVNSSIIYEYNGEPATFVQVKSYTLHPFNSRANAIVALDYNIGVIELSESLQFGPGIQQIDLPKPNDYPAVGSILSVTGFGAKNYGGTLQVDSPLQAVQTLVVNNNQCTEDFIGKVVITERQACTSSITGKSDEGPCEGDAGSPAAFEGVLHGLYAFGDCGHEGHASVYTSLAGLVDFVNNTTAASNH